MQLHIQQALLEPTALTATMYSSHSLLFCICFLLQWSVLVRKDDERDAESVLDSNFTAEDALKIIKQMAEWDGTGKRPAVFDKYELVNIAANHRTAAQLQCFKDLPSVRNYWFSRVKVFFGLSQHDMRKVV